LQREYARAPKGEIVEDVRRGSKFARTNVIGAMCETKHFGVECYRQTTNSAFFERRFTECLLKEVPEGYTVIPDNARFHRKKVLRRLAGGKVRLLFLPPYSPDYNPIEKSRANTKRFPGNNTHDFQSIDLSVYNYFDVSDIYIK
jgi:hypothetical protein